MVAAGQPAHRTPHRRRDPPYILLAALQKTHRYIPFKILFKTLVISSASLAGTDIAN
jgi:hypothetical protein